ncbi:metallophosphoesterase [Paenibacillus spiritus]|uniref:Metallophosphoesterase n=1 Tax=Paenibacillus spiritus TaxID=2496557 RepID=A0A5J5GHI7_9BACL|nr:metallophosphoesterase [Paenibacillus spiritus]KAA9007192.1 metallophosphoesterase [Paenibacillus spiritus]
MVTVLAWAVLILALAGLALLGWMYALAHGGRLIEQELTLEELDRSFDGLQLLLVTDIHSRRLPERLIAPVRGRAAAVLAGGDLTELDNKLERMKANMRLLASVAPVYAVSGNHDVKVTPSEFEEVLRKTGIRLLKDENIVLAEGRDTRLWLTGIDYPKRGVGRSAAPPPHLPPGSAADNRIILVHDPIWLEGREKVPADLVLSGHTHGGQIVLPVLGRRHVKEAFYRRYSAGLFRWPDRPDGSGATRVFISRGYGTAHLPFRWGSPAEIHLLTLRSGQPDTEDVQGQGTERS